MNFVKLAARQLGRMKLVKLAAWPRRLEKWFVYLATLTRKTNWAVVEQHGLVHQCRGSSGPKKERFGVFDKKSRF